MDKTNNLDELPTTKKIKHMKMDFDQLYNHRAEDNFCMKILECVLQCNTYFKRYIDVKKQKSIWSLKGV